MSACRGGLLPTGAEHSSAGFFVSFCRPGVRGAECRYSLSATVEGGNHGETRRLESIAKARIEFGQRVCSVFLILNRKIFPVTAYFPAAHLERFEIANITWMQDV